MPRFSLLALIGFTSFAGLASAALVQPSIGWTSVVISLTAVILVWQVLRLVLTSGETRAAASGWLIFAIGYLAIVLGPHANHRIGPHLLSSKLLVHALVKWHKIEQPNPPAQEWLNWGAQFNSNAPALWGQAIDGTSNTIWMDYAVAYSLPSTGPIVCFQLTGHWLFAWLVGWMGSLIAVQLQRYQMSRRALV
jgi:uncharacterized membrane protein